MTDKILSFQQHRAIKEQDSSLWTPKDALEYALDLDALDKYNRCIILIASDSGFEHIIAGIRMQSETKDIIHSFHMYLTLKSMGLIP